MWQAPNQRVRAIANAKKRERDKAKKPIHIKRVNAQIEVREKYSGSNHNEDIRLILNDFTQKSASLFASKPLAAGQEVVLNISEPSKISLHAHVAWCQDHAATSHILSDHPFAYRLVIEFDLATPEEKESVKVFCGSVYKNVLYPNRTAA